MIMLASSLSFRRAPQWMEDEVGTKKDEISKDNSLSMQDAMKTNEF